MKLLACQMELCCVLMVNASLQVTGDVCHIACSVTNSIQIDALMHKSKIHLYHLNEAVTKYK